MGPKKKPLEDIKKEDLVQGVIIADSYDSKFGPLTQNKPRCLLPLANRPLLAYTLDLFKLSGVHEVFVYCTSFPDQIKAYLKSPEWREQSGFAITVLTSEDARCFGDAIRDLDTKGLLRQDFILARGDSICNVDLAPYLAAHKERTKVDKNATMTVICKKAAPGHHCRTADEELFLATDGDGSRILHYQRANSSKINVPLEIFESHPEVKLCFDLLDPGLSICTPGMPLLFSDNFDFQTLDHLVKGVIEDDLLENTIYLAELTEGYAARVSNLHTYQSVTSDVMRRWAYPLVPDMRRVSLEEGGYKYAKNNIYRGKGIVLSRGSMLEEDTIIGPKTSIGESSTLTSCVVGANCNIGKNVNIKNSIILADVVIEENCQLDGVVIGNRVKLEKNVVINAKSVLGDEVEIPAGTQVPSESRLISKPQESDGFSDDEDDKPDENGVFGDKAFAFEDEQDSDSEDEERLVQNMWGLTLQSQDEDSSSSDDSDFDGMDDGADIMIDDDAKFQVFLNEVLESLTRGFKEGINNDNLILEINSSRHAYAVTATQVVESVTGAVLSIAASNVEGEANSAKLLKEIQKSIKLFESVMRKYVRGESSQVDCLTAIEQFTQENRDFLPVATKTIHNLYELEILSEEAIFKWFGGKTLEVTDFGKTFRSKVKPFIEWLQESEDESEDDESD